MDRGAWGLQPVGSHRVRHDCRALARTHTCDTILLLRVKAWTSSSKVPVVRQRRGPQWDRRRSPPQAGRSQEGRRSEVPHSHPGELPEQREGKREAPGQEEARETHPLSSNTLPTQQCPSAPPTKEKGEVRDRPPEEQSRGSLPELGLGPSSAPQGIKVSGKDTGALASPHLRASAEHPYTVPGKGDAQKVIFL